MTLAAPLRVGYHRVDGDYAFRAHAHGDRYEWTAVTRGRLGARVGATEWTLARGWGVLIAPGMRHGYWDAGTGRNPAIYFNASFAGTGGYLEVLSRLGPFPLPKGAGRFWEGTAAHRIWEGRFAPERVLGFLQANLSAWAETPARVPPPGGRASSLWHFESRLADLMDEAPGHLHSRMEMARHFGLRPNAFTNRVTRLTGSGPMAIYDRLKMNRACQILHSGKSVSEAAHLLGYANPYHFSRKFLGVVGVRPSLWAWKTEPGRRLPGHGA